MKPVRRKSVQVAASAAAAVVAAASAANVVASAAAAVAVAVAAVTAAAVAVAAVATNFAFAPANRFFSHLKRSLPGSAFLFCDFGWSGRTLIPMIRMPPPPEIKEHLVRDHRGVRCLVPACIALRLSSAVR